MTDGLLGKCKDCARRDALQHRNRTIEKARAYDRERSKLPHRVALHADGSRRRRALNPERHRAHQQLRRAVKKGIVKRLPCSVCGSQKSIGHHPDYSKPIDVVWLCQPHHAAVHFGKIHCPNAAE